MTFYPEAYDEEVLPPICLILDGLLATFSFALILPVKIKIPTLLLFSLPVLLMTSTYLIMGDISIKFYGWDNALFQIDTLEVPLRLMLAIIPFANGLMLYIITSRFVSIYNKHIAHNYSDPSYYIHFTKQCFYYALSVLFFYAMYELTLSLWAEAAYYVFVPLVFAIMLHKIMFYKAIAWWDDFSLQWDWKTLNWVVIKKQEENQVQPNLSLSDTSVIIDDIKEWMITSKPYLNSDFSSNDIFEYCNGRINRNNLSNIMMEAYGSNFMAAIQKLRIDEAKELMKKSVKMPIKEICFAVGFTSQQAFSRYFKQITGVTPTEFRENQKTVIG